MNRKQLFFRLSQWFLARSGDSGKDAWLELQAETARIRKEYGDREARRMAQMAELYNKVPVYHELLKDVGIVDSLLSEDLFAEAQRYLRVALIKAKRPASEHYMAQLQQRASQGNMQNSVPLGGALGQADFFSGMGVSGLGRFFGSQG